MDSMYFSDHRQILKFVNRLSSANILNISDIFLVKLLVDQGLVANFSLHQLNRFNCSLDQPRPFGIQNTMCHVESHII